MRTLGGALLLTATLPLVGCFQAATVIKVKADGSGTIEQRMLITDAAIEQMRALAILGGTSARDVPDPVSEPQARGLATSLGPGVTYVSSEPVKTATGRGRHAVYTFTDITQVRVSGQPPVPGGVSVTAQGVSTNIDPITFALSRNPDGSAVLRLLVPTPPLLTFSASGPAAAQLEMAKQILAGARVTVDVEPQGRLIRTSSPHVEGNRVTLVDVDFDQIVGDATLLTRLQAAKTTGETKEALRRTPGLKLPLDPETTIEFTPEQ